MGRYDLNLAEDDFWGLTLKEFNALAERQQNNHDWQNYRTALICSIVANTARDPKRRRKPFTPDDFMPHKQHPGQTPEQIFAQVQLLNAAFGGNVLED